jgi:hypothetical protein
MTRGNYDHLLAKDAHLRKLSNCRRVITKPKTIRSEILAAGHVKANVPIDASYPTESDLGCRDRAAVCNYNLAGRTLAIICIRGSIGLRDVTVTPRCQYIHRLEKSRPWKSY